MKRYAGIWLDHRKAVIVTLHLPKIPYENGHEDITVEEIASDIERRTRLSGGSRTRKTPWGPQEVAVEQKIEERHKHQRKQYYRKLIDILKTADRILIMGPGEAKVEFHRELTSSAKGMSHCVISIETHDKMTDSQIADRVRSYFYQVKSCA